MDIEYFQRFGTGGQRGNFLAFLNYSNHSFFHMEPFPFQDIFRYGNKCNSSSILRDNNSLCDFMSSTTFITYTMFTSVNALLGRQKVSKRLFC